MESGGLKLCMTRKTKPGNYMILDIKDYAIVVRKKRISK
jgi:hypothetical protein